MTSAELGGLLSGFCVLALICLWLAGAEAWWTWSPTAQRLKAWVRWVRSLLFFLD